MKRDLRSSNNSLKSLCGIIAEYEQYIKYDEYEKTLNASIFEAVGLVACHMACIEQDKWSSIFFGYKTTDTFDDNSQLYYGCHQSTLFYCELKEAAHSV